MKKFVLKNRLRNPFPVNIKSLRGPTTTITLPVKGSIEVWEYQLTGDVYIKQHNGLLELKLIEDYTNKQNTEVPTVTSTPISVPGVSATAVTPVKAIQDNSYRVPAPELTPEAKTIQQEAEIVEAVKKSKRGRPTSKVVDAT